MKADAVDAVDAAADDDDSTVAIESALSTPTPMPTMSPTSGDVDAP
jgi:hypothetical protein